MHCRHLKKIGAGGLEFSFQSLLLMCRRELPWEEANSLWDGLFAQHMALSTQTCPFCSPIDFSSSWISPARPGDAMHQVDVLRSLAVSSAASLVMSHRKPFLACQSLEEVVQLSNRLPSLGPGAGIHLARGASEFLQQERNKQGQSPVSSRYLLCGCVGASTTLVEADDGRGEQQRRR